MDAVDRFLNLVASSRGLPAPPVDVSRAVLNTIRARQQAAIYFDFAPLAITATLAIAAGVF
ncbi:MAG TPA: hypothetical protein VL096_14480, partial [Pirellulaceae bacterium]|nr:hypothetical protein [Pirellulaceae bacterium]